MSLQLSIPGSYLLETKTVLPDHYNGPIIPGAKIVSFSNEQQELNYQEAGFEDFSIRLLTGHSFKRFEINECRDENGLRGWFMIKNGIRKKMNRIGKVHLREGHHMLYYLSSPHGAFILDDTKEFQGLEIFYSSLLLEQLKSFFPKLDQIVGLEKEALIGNKTFWTAPHIRENFRQLLYSHYDESLQNLYFGLKVREVLFHLLQNSLNINDGELKITPYEISKIYEAKSILEKYIDKKPPTIRQLSRMVAINEFKLKRGFQQLFHSGIFTWITSEKMYWAKRQLEETSKPIKEIAALAGYPRTTNFITAFRKQFGITPGAIRRS